MKILFAIFIYILININISHAQHSISIHGGGSVSNLQKYGTPTALEGAGVYSDLFSTTPYFSPYLGGEYEFHFEPYIFSAGISFLTIGADNFFYKNYSTAEMYLTLPLLIGRKWEVSNDFSISAKAGFDLGWKILNFGEIASAGNIDKANANIGAAGVVQVNWKRTSFGARLHVGLSNYFSWNVNNSKEQVHFRHSAVTLYVGYTLWKSKLKAAASQPNLK
jgi:hypothetical protein